MRPRKTTIRRIALGSAAATLLMLGGCGNDAQSGALLGAGLGAGLGAVIGHQSGETGAGAAIGGAVGGAAGYGIGNESDKAKANKQYDY